MVLSRLATLDLGTVRCTLKSSGPVVTGAAAAVLSPRPSGGGGEAASAQQPGAAAAAGQAESEADQQQLLQQAAGGATPPHGVAAVAIFAPISLSPVGAPASAQQVKSPRGGKPPLHPPPQQQQQPRPESPPNAASSFSASNGCIAATAAGGDSPSQQQQHQQQERSLSFVTVRTSISGSVGRAALAAVRATSFQARNNDDKCTTLFDMRNACFVVWRPQMVLMIFCFSS